MMGRINAATQEEEKMLQAEQDTVDTFIALLNADDIEDTIITILCSFDEAQTEMMEGECL